jgi:pentatricopeptide repeat protein
MEDSIMAYNILIGNFGERGHFEKLGEVCKLIPKRISDK